MAVVPTDRDSVLDATKAIVDRVAANAAAGETARRLEPDSVAAMKQAGIWRILTPSRFGGSELDLRTHFETIAILAEAHPSAGWLELVTGAHTYLLGSWPEVCQEEVFADDPDVIVPGTLAAQGAARDVDGGWTVSGRWQFCSGIDHGKWVMVGAARENGSAQADPGANLVHVVLPKEDVTVDDTWYVMGLRATGSKDIVLDDVFVPEHRGIASNHLLAGSSPHATIHDTNLYRLPLAVVLGMMLSAAHLGIANRTLRLHLDRTRVRSDVYTKTSTAEKAGQQMRVAESSAEIMSAELLLLGVCDQLAEIAQSGELATFDQRVQLKWQIVYGSELCRRATERIFRAAGAHGIYDKAEIQGAFRDMNTACHHALVDFDSMAEAFGRVSLGLDPGPGIV
jgi:alkylation response protein AidB-like acyl-CoA dehydrogenase